MHNRAHSAVRPQRSSRKVLKRSSPHQSRRSICSSNTSLSTSISTRRKPIRHGVVSPRPFSTTVTAPSSSEPQPSTAVLSAPVQSSKPPSTSSIPDELATKVAHQEKLATNFVFRSAERLRDYQSISRALILSVPAVATMWTAHKTAVYFSSVIDIAGIDQDLTSNALMALGAAQAAVAYGLFYTGKKILQLANQPSQELLEDVVRRTLRLSGVSELLGKQFTIGKFTSVSVVPENKLSQSKQKHIRSWLQHNPAAFTQPIPDVPLPAFISNMLATMPAFQTVAWNKGVSQRLEADMKNHPEDYLPESSSSSSEEVGDTSVAANQTHELALASASADQKTKTPTQESTNESKVDDSSQSESESEHLTTPPTHPGRDITVSPQKNRISSILPNFRNWDSYWQPRHIQFTLHLVGEKDEGLLLCQADQFQFGSKAFSSGGLMEYAVLEFVSFKTGKVTDLANNQLATILSPQHVEDLVEMMPPDFPRVPQASFDHIMIETKYKDDIHKSLLKAQAKEKRGIYF